MKNIFIILFLVVTFSASCSTTINKIDDFTTTINYEDIDGKVVDRVPPSTLELSGLSWSRTSSAFITIVGEVKNLSEEKLETVQIVATCSNTNGIFVYQNYSLIKSNDRDLMSGQSSTFTIMVPFNSAIKEVELSIFDSRYKYLQGELKSKTFY